MKYISRFLLNMTRSSRMKRFRELKERSRWQPEAIRKRQEKDLLALLSHAKANVPYYRKVLSALEINSLQDLSSIPFLTKKDIKANINDLKAANCPGGRFIPNSTGGSTGEKLEFFSDKNQILAPLVLRSNSWTGWEVGEKQMQLWGAHYDISKVRGFSSALKRFFIQRNRMLSSYQMTEKDMLAYHSEIESHRPALITGYPSSMALFSKFIRSRGLNVHSPKGIVTSAETLYPRQREIIESVFKCSVFNRYGCREAGNIAQECEEHKGLHIFSEHVIVEIIDEKGITLEPGRRGEIVITVLDNYAFPFIRYRIGDLGVLSDRLCRCGRNLPMLERVEGRVFDIVVGTNGNHLPGTYWTILLREYIAGISKYQVIQEEHGRLLLKLETDQSFTEEEEARLIGKIREDCGRDMKVDVELVGKIPQTESGKHRFIISKVSPYVGGL